MFSFKGDFILGWGFNGAIFISLIFIREIMIYTGINKRIKIRGTKGILIEMVFYALLIALIIFFRGNGSEFIYFQF